MNAEELAYAGLAKQAEMVRNGSVTSVELVKAALERIERHDPLLNAFRTVMAEEALAAAAEADRTPASDSQPLRGVPIAIKDDVDVAGQSTRYGSDATSATPKEQDAELVRRLRAAGAIIIGKTNVPELTQWPFTETDAYGVTRNPWNTAHTPGGSSGGTGAAIAAGMVPAALGSDGGGSIRIPAACCGLVGIKPQRGRVPIAPKTDAWFGLSVFGPLARSVADAALFLDVIADRTPSEAPFTDAVGADPGKLRVAWSVKSPLPVPVAADQKRAVEQIVAVLGGLGHTTQEADPAYGPTIFSFIARYLRGIAKDANAVENPQKLESRTKGMVRMAKPITDRMLERAMAAEPNLTARLGRIFTDHDILVTPVLAQQPLPVGKFAGRGALWVFNGCARFTPFPAPWNVTGQPCVSVPAGFDGDGLPLGVQIIGPPNSEALLISIAAQIEAQRPWADRRPPLDA